MCTRSRAKVDRIWSPGARLDSGCPLDRAVRGKNGALPHSNQTGSRSTGGSSGPDKRATALHFRGYRALGAGRASGSSEAARCRIERGSDALKQLNSPTIDAPFPYLLCSCPSLQSSLSLFWLDSDASRTMRLPLVVLLALLALGASAAHDNQTNGRPHRQLARRDIDTDGGLNGSSNELVARGMSAAQKKKAAVAAAAKKKAA